MAVLSAVIKSTFTERMGFFKMRFSCNIMYKERYTIVLDGKKESLADSKRRLLL